MDQITIVRIIFGSVFDPYDFIAYTVGAILVYVIDVKLIRVDKLNIQSNYGDMGIGGYIVLLETIQKAGLQDNFDYEFLLHTVKKLVYNTIERNTSKWVYYCVRPSNYITVPDSIFYKDNEDIIQKELDYLIETRVKNNVWNITWSWFENNEKYAKEFAISENWWKAYKAIENIIFKEILNGLTNEVFLKTSMFRIIILRV